MTAVAEPIIQGLVDDELKSILSGCLNRMEMSCKVFSPDRFNIPFSYPLHVDGMFPLLDDRKKKKVAMALPRGVGKTSCVENLAVKSIEFKEYDYIVYVSASATQAMERTENIKYELNSNEVLVKLFGSMQSTKTDEQYSREAYVTSNGVKVLPRGGGQQIRGLNFRGKRPGLILVDDFEDSEAVLNEEIRKKRKQWFYSDLMKAVDPASDWRIIVIGTILHEDSLLANLVESNEWESVNIGIANSKTMESNWPEQVSTEALIKELKEHQDMGLDAEWWRERMNQVVPDNASFTSDMFQYYDEDEDYLNYCPEVENVILVDPAKTVTPTSAYSAIACIAYNLDESKIYVRDLVMQRLHQDELQDEALTMAQRCNARVIGLEVTSLNEYITGPFITEMTRRGLNYHIEELTPRGRSKPNRIKALLPYYRRRQIWHNRGACMPLEQQLMSFPRSRYEDAMDAVAYLVQLMEVGGRWFRPPHNPGHNIEDDMRELRDMYEEAPSGNGKWRF